MNILLPKVITQEMFAEGTTIPEVDTDVGEVSWVSGSTYAIKDRRVWKGYTYECVAAITSAPANTYEPGSANSKGLWLKDENAPTNRMAPFDKYLFTKARRPTSLTYVLKPGFVSGIAIYGIEADVLEIKVQADGVDLIDPISFELWQQAFGEYEYLFGDLQRGTYYTLKNIPIHPDVEITITVKRNNEGVEAAVGYISVGNWKKLLAPMRRDASGVLYGVESSTKDYSIINDNADGTWTDIEGRKSTNINLNCLISADQSPAAKILLDQILGKTVAIEVSELAKYSHLATVGKVTGTIRNSDTKTANVALEIKGNV